MESGLYEVEEKILIALFPDRELSQNSLSNDVGHDASTIKRWTKKLLNKNLVEKHLEEVNERPQKTHRLTDKGREVAAKLVKEDRQRHLDLAEQRSEQLDEWERMKE